MSSSVTNSATSTGGDERRPVLHASFATGAFPVPSLLEGCPPEHL